MNNLLENIYTTKEAAELWGISDSALRKAINRNRFNEGDVKKSAGTWLIYKDAMIRVFGEIDTKTSIYTIGYEGKDINVFLNILNDNNIHTVFDVREIPLSRKKGFSKNTLCAALSENNIGYYNFKELGSPKEIREKLYRTKDYEAFFFDYRKYLRSNPDSLEIIRTAIVENRDKNFCLLCFENSPNECHRSVIANELLVSDDNISRIINL